MSVNPSDILLIQKYLNGELDTRAMHELELLAMDDPFLADALEGYAQNKLNPSAQLQELDQRLQQRIQPKARHIRLWPALTIAASVLIFISIGGWWLLNYRQPVQRSNTLPADKTEVATNKPAPILTPPAPPVNEQPVIRPAAPQHMVSPVVAESDKIATTVAPDDAKSNKLKDFLKKIEKIQVDSDGHIIRSSEQVAAALKLQIVKADTVTYKASSYAKNALSLKPVGIDSAVSDRVASVRINGKDFKGIQNDVAVGSSSIRIRGSRTVTDKEPLYVVDGIVVDKAPNMRAEDLASIEILKDASSTAIYGARAANGVVLITTKKGAVVSGQVLAQSDGKPLPGVTIQVAGKSATAVTDVNGQFIIAAAPNDVLDVKYVGFENQTVKVTNRQALQVKLIEDSHALAEVAIVSNPVKTDTKAHPAQGWPKFNDYLKNIHVADGKTGTVKLSFTVNPNGTVSDFKISQSLSPNADQQAIDLIKNGPKWMPNINGKPETVKLKIVFR